MAVMKLIDGSTNEVEFSPRPGYKDIDSQNRMNKYAIDGTLHIIRPYKTKKYSIPLSNINSTDASQILTWWENAEPLDFYHDLINDDTTSYVVKIINSQAPLNLMFTSPNNYEGTIELLETTYSETPDVESRSFTECCQAKTALPQIEFTYATTDYSSRVLDVSPISRNADLSACECVVTLDNADGAFDDFLDDHTELYQQGSIKIKFAGLATTQALFTGYVESIEMGVKTIVFRLLDRISLLLQKTVGSGANPITYVANPPSTMVWDLLTTYAELDDTASSLNTDIDYDSYEDWILDMNEFGNAYYIAGYCAGESVGYLLRRISELTNSIFWINGLGKLQFASMSAYAVGAVPITSEFILSYTYFCDLHGIVNDITCQYELDLDAGTWLAEATGQRFYGPTTFATSLAEEDRTVWHDDQASADRFIDETFDRLAGPFREFSITTAMLGFLSDVGKVETLSSLYASPNNSIDINIQEITYDVINCEVTLKGQWLWDMS